MNPKPEIINENRLILDGFVYVRSKPWGNKTHWDCHLLRRGQRTAPSACFQVVTGPGAFIATKTPVEKEGVEKSKEKSEHTHPPNTEYVGAEKMKLSFLYNKNLSYRIYGCIIWRRCPGKCRNARA